MIQISHPTKHLEGVIRLPSSKSISNRILMLQKMYHPSLELKNLSNANDTQLLIRLLSEEKNDLFVQDAGTAFRFLVAYCATTEGTWTVYGTTRLNSRPISELVDVLRLVGAEIAYLNDENCAPIRITGKQLQAKTDIIDLTKVKSSQFVSAFLMIAPRIAGDFKIRIDQRMNSFSYVLLTQKVMQEIGFSVEIVNDLITVSKTPKLANTAFYVEPDWTSFYYWYALAFLSDKADLLFPGIGKISKADEPSCLAYVENEVLVFDYQPDGLRIKKTTSTEKSTFKTNYSFSQFPDLAPTFAFLLPALGCENAIFLGLESLKYKECDREEAIAQLLKKMGVRFTKNADKWVLDAATFELEGSSIFETYKDHRMAMSLAPLALLQPIQIADEDVVQKSYPHFWSDLESVGFKINYL